MTHPVSQRDTPVSQRDTPVPQRDTDHFVPRRARWSAPFDWQHGSAVPVPEILAGKIPEILTPLELRMYVVSMSSEPSWR